MRKKIIHLLSLTVLFLVLQSCAKEEKACYESYTYWTEVPEYHSWEEIRADIVTKGPQVLKKPGKIYFYQDYIFINEQRKGIHIVDNSVPAAPTFVSFIAIPGNMDMSIRNSVLYADNYTDLLTIDLTDLTDAKLIKRVENAFPPDYIDPAKGVLTHYKQEEVTQVVNCQEYYSLSIGVNPVFDANGGGRAGGDGIGGSFARFTLVGDYLYTVSDRDISVFDLQDFKCPVQANTLSIGFGIETIFPYDGRLFVGSTMGMNIYDLGNPTVPEYISGYDHWTGCDPVFVAGNYAYVTIRSGRFCGQAIDQLDVLDISNIYNPVLEKSFEMENPQGLSIKNETLYLCEGQAGLKVFDVRQPLVLNEHLKAHLKDFAAYDVITLPGADPILLLIGEDGFYQFDISDPFAPIKLSHIPAVN
ncbi:MAG: LVIVD repeat-containing protein [Saprospiraceae bacterium]